MGRKRAGKGFFVFLHRAAAAVTAAFLFPPSPAAAATISSTETLVNLLVEKKILDPEEGKRVLASSPSPAAKIPEKETVVSGKFGLKHVLTGFIEADAHFGDPVLRAPDNTVEVRRARLGLEGTAAEKIFYKIMTESASGSFLRDAKITYAAADWLVLHAGQYKAPFGREFLISSPYLNTIERSAVSNAVVPDRQIGGSAAGSAADGKFYIEAGAFNGNGIGERNDDAHFLYAGRLTAVVFEEKIGEETARIEAGGNLAASEDSAAPLPGLGFPRFAGRRDLMGLDAHASWGRWSVLGEFLRAELEPDEGEPVEGEGFWVSAACFILLNRLEAVVKYEDFNLDGAPDFEALTLGLNYYITPYAPKTFPTRFMVNYVHGGAEESDDEDQVLMRMEVGY